MPKLSSNDFGIWGNSILGANLTLIWILLLLLFRALPEVDLAVSNTFFDPNFCDSFNSTRRCIAFPIAFHPIFLPMRELLNVLPATLGVGLFVLCVRQWIIGMRWHDVAFRKTVLVFAALLVGPLMITNGLFKSFFGRVRPRDVTDFGGALDFTLAGDFIGQCARNCSFISGEGAAGGWFLCLAVFAPPRFRLTAYLVLFVIGFGMALLRVAFGAHFLSDALLGYLSSLVVFAILVSVNERFFARRTET